MDNKTYWLAFFSFFLPSLTFAQSAVLKPNFAVQLGVFKVPDERKFQLFADLGNILTDSVAGGLVRLRLGDYTDRAKADSVLSVLRGRGLKSVFIIIAPDSSPAKGFLTASAQQPTAYVVQLGAYADRSSMPSNLDKVKTLGNLQELEENDLRKLQLGTYDSRKQAMAQANSAKQLGFKNAFVSVAAPTTLKRETLVRGATGKSFEITNTYKRMEGLLNNKLPVVVQMYFNGASLLGFYSDPETGESKKFVYYGYQTNDARLAKVTKDGSQISGSAFEPKGAIAGQQLRITAKDQANGKELKFNLKEVYSPQSVQIVIKSLYRKKVQPAKEGEIGADLYLEYPIITRSGNASLAPRLNPKFVLLKGVTNPSTLNGQADIQLADGLKKVTLLYPQYRWLSETLETKVLENDKDLLSVRFVEECVIAEPKSKVSHKSFIISTGQELKLGELLLSGHDKVLRASLRQKIGKKYAGSRPTLTDVNTSIEEMIQNYYFTTKGIVFYRQYHANSAIQEPIELTVDYKEIRSLIKPASLLSRF